MNILLSSYVHWWNAEAAYTAKLAEALLDAGHHAWILTRPETRNAVELARRGLPLITHIPPPPGNPFGWPSSLKLLRKFQAEKNIELVNVFRAREFLWHRVAARDLPRPKVIRTRGSAHPLRKGYFNRRIYGDWCDGLIASSGVVARELTEVLAISPEKIHTIYYPAEPPLERTPEELNVERKKLLDSLGLSPEVTLMGIVGRLYPEKGHSILIEALETLVQQYPSLALVIFAKAEDDKEGPALEEQIRQAGLENHVRFTGFLENMQDLMAVLDVGVISSISSEVNCRVAMEYFSAGVPVVTFPTGALPEVIKHDRTGLVASDHSSEALAASIAAMLDNPDRAREMAAAARAEARGRFSRETFLRQTLKVYEKALNEPEE